MRSVFLLGAGTIFAQVITVASSPILTRLYRPEDFGLAAVFIAIIASITPAICGKYEVAIVVARPIEISHQLLGVAFAFALVVSLISLSFITFFQPAIIAAFGAERLAPWLLLIPVMLMLTGLLTALRYYANRTNEYRVISQSKVLMAATTVFASLVLGLLDFEAGLLVSAVLATAMVVTWLLYRYRHIGYRDIIKWNAHTKRVAKQYRQFPLYNASTGLLDGITQALPIFFLSSHFAEALVGYYALMIRVAAAPLSFISSSVSQVNLKKVADLVHEGGSVRLYLAKLTLLLFVVVSPFAVFLMLFSPALFAWFFGEQWRVAGDYLQILMPALAVRFIVSTVSTTFGATGNNGLAGMWKVIAFVGTFLVLLIAAPRVDANGIMMTILITDLALYTLYLLLAWHAAGHPRAMGHV